MDNSDNIIKKVCDKMSADNLVCCSWCDELIPKIDCDYDADIGWVCSSCQNDIVKHKGRLRIRENFSSFNEIEIAYLNDELEDYLMHKIENEDYSIEELIQIIENSEIIDINEIQDLLDNLLYGWNTDIVGDW